MIVVSWEWLIKEITWVNDEQIHFRISCYHESWLFDKCTNILHFIVLKKYLQLIKWNNKTHFFVIISKLLVREIILGYTYPLLFLKKKRCWTHFLSSAFYKKNYSRIVLLRYLKIIVESSKNYLLLLKKRFYLCIEGVIVQRHAPINDEQFHFRTSCCNGSRMLYKCSNFLHFIVMKNCMQLI